MDELVLGLPGANRSTFGIHAECNAMVAASSVCQLSASGNAFLSLPTTFGEQLVALPSGFAGVFFTVAVTVGWILIVEKHVSENQEIVVVDLQALTRNLLQMGILHDRRQRPGIIISVRFSIGYPCSDSVGRRIRRRRGARPHR